ncbi:hypothetical protein [Aliamphritea spongicola]|nr:hypothetical protein [Aliamphritea spongicola]
MAAVHHVEPYPDVGFKYHAVMMLSSVHNTLRHLDESEQWLGMLWAADTFKQAQQRDTFNGDWELADAIDANSNDPLGILSGQWTAGTVKGRTLPSAS